MVDVIAPKIGMGRFDSVSYGEQYAIDRLEDWGIEPKYQKHVDRLQDRALGTGLLGVRMGTILTLDGKDGVESVLGALTRDVDLNFKAKSLDLTDGDAGIVNRNARRLAGNGMFIILKANIQLGASKNLVKLFRAMEWEYQEPAKDVSGEINRILSGTSLPVGLRQMLVDHVGDDYDRLIPVVKGIASMSPKEQKALSWEELWMRLDPRPGSIPPWGGRGQAGLFDYVLRGDTSSALAFYDRVVQSGTVVIQFAGWLVNSIGQYAMMKLLVDYGGQSLDDAARMAGLSAPSSGYGPDPVTGKRNGWAVEKNYRVIKSRKITELALKDLVRLTADDLTMIKKRGKLVVADHMGNPVLDDSGMEVSRWVDRPVDEELDDVAVGLRMVLRASETFAGRLNVAR